MTEKFDWTQKVGDAFLYAKTASLRRRSSGAVFFWLPCSSLRLLLADAMRRANGTEPGGLTREGICVIRTNECSRAPADVVRSYKGLARVERTFRTLKGIDLRGRPVHNRSEDHVRAHIFPCMLTYYVEWYMRTALTALAPFTLFTDPTLLQARALALLRL